MKKLTLLFFASLLSSSLWADPVIQYYDAKGTDGTNKSKMDATYLFEGKKYTVQGNDDPSIEMSEVYNLIGSDKNTESNDSTTLTSVKDQTGADLSNIDTYLSINKPTTDQVSAEVIEIDKRQKNILNTLTILMKRIQR